MRIDLIPMQRSDRWRNLTVSLRSNFVRLFIVDTISSANQLLAERPHVFTWHLSQVILLRSLPAVYSWSA